MTARRLRIVELRHFTLWTFAAAFLVRLLCVLALRNPHKFHGAQAGADAVEFNAIALHLVRLHEFSVTLGHPTSFRAPGFPFVLAGVYSLSYESYLLAYLLQCILGALGCVLAYRLARELMGERDARWCALLAVAYMPAIYLCTVLLSEPLFAAIFALALLLFLRYLHTARWPYLLFSGLALGYSALTRPVALLVLAGLLCLLVWKMARDRSFRLLPALALLAGFVLVVAPWAWRNDRVQHQFVLVATNGGSTFYGSNNDLVLHNRALLGRWVSTTQLPHRAEIEATPDEVSHDKLEQKLGEQWVRTHLLSMPRLELYKSVRLWLPDFTSGNRKFVLVETVCFLPYLVLFFVGFARCLRERSYWTLPWWTLHVALLSLIATSLIFNGDPRYRDGDYTALMPYAAVGLGKLRAMLGRNRQIQPA